MLAKTSPSRTGFRSLKGQTNSKWNVARHLTNTLTTKDDNWKIRSFHQSSTKMTLFRAKQISQTLWRVMKYWTKLTVTLQEQSQYKENTKAQPSSSLVSFHLLSASLRRCWRHAGKSQLYGEDRPRVWKWRRWKLIFEDEVILMNGRQVTVIFACLSSGRLRSCHFICEHPVRFAGILRETKRVLLQPITI